MNRHLLHEGLDDGLDSGRVRRAGPGQGRAIWPDDGLPPRFAGSAREHSPLHPFGVMGSILGRR